ncbi:hypothetical protein LINPERPRIM_LOCUS40398 [Linum perenne]
MKSRRSVATGIIFVLRRSLRV